MTDREPAKDVSWATFTIAMTLAAAALVGFCYLNRPPDQPTAGPADEQQIYPDRSGFLPTIRNSIGMTLARVPHGEFVMGDPVAANARPHRVRITNSYHIGTHEVTQAQYKLVTGRMQSEFAGPDGAPVDSVTWEDAREFCQKLSERPAEQTARRIYRLPTEAEWEYACRAGTTSLFWFGNQYKPMMANTHFGGIRRTATVGLYPPNPWGLYDMHGNVWEWCADWYGVDYYVQSPRDDPAGPETGTVRVTRGGSWDDRPELARSGYRNDAFSPDYRGPKVGFRVVCDVK
ncbi:MAG TPA: formylglycine-generating enzyme family protein [Gemmataceae bacterium]|jgi:formylglycine-generating enzyme required for sulfatase activity|nr:formylglycine-generating enzyme family protein [Gemmataceae bacterium]